MRRPLVLGIGNPLRGDDGFGAAVIAELRRGGLGAQADLLWVHQLTPELILDLEGARCVAFVDAAVALAAGEASESELAASVRTRGSWSHGLDPGGLLALGREVLGVDVPARIFAVGAAGFGEGASLTPLVQEQVARTALRIAAWCDGLPG